MTAEDRSTVLHEVDDITVHYSAPHPPRKASPVYVRAHHDLIYIKLTPCWVCGLMPGPDGKFEDVTMVNETHHDLIEQAAFMAVDILKVEADEPAWDWSKVDPHDNSTFYVAGDAAPAMRVLCSVHHRATRPTPDHRGILGVGIHHAPMPLWILQRYIRPEYPLFVADDSKPFRSSAHLHPNVTEHVKQAHAERQRRAAVMPGSP